MFLETVERDTSHQEAFSVGSSGIRLEFIVEWTSIGYKFRQMVGGFIMRIYS